MGVIDENIQHINGIRPPTSLLRGVKGREERLAGRSLVLDLLGTFLLLALLLEEFLPPDGLCVGVKAEENGLVDERVLLLCPGTLLGLLASRADDGLDLGAVDETGNVGIGDLGSGEEVVLLVGGSLVEGSEDLVQEAESTLRPDNEATQVTTRCELQKVESPDVNNLDTRKVAECSNNTVVFVVDNERTTALTVPAVPHLSFTGTQFARIGDLDDVGVGVERLEESNSFLGFLERLDLVGDDQGNFLDLLNAVTTSKDERRESRCGKGRNNSKPALVLVHLDMPFAPGLGRSEHTTTAAHVTECSLSGTMSSSTSDTGNTGDGTTSTPRFSRSLMASLLAHGVSLPFVLSDAFMHLSYNIKPDRCSKNCREGKGGRGLTSGRANINGGS